ncbi:MAG TPA: hypothetical protein VH044_07065 [Polyangiaceae bacterium]|jgi:hypothetical protein|nr:hypothetical protein [Polyangiaceae bacterium]
MRYFAIAIAAATGALLFAACDSTSDSAPYYGSGRYDSCRQYASCGTCTPADGCGWCFDSDGTGECVSDPDFCATPAFTWTWNETGCRVPAEAGTGAPPPTVGDDASPAPTLDAALQEDAAPLMLDAGPTALDAAPPAVDAQPIEVP